MLARTVLTADELGITEKEHAALLEVRRMLASGEAVHLRDHPGTYFPVDAKGFNMNVSCSLDEGCGTVACIGGWMGLIMGKNRSAAASYVEGPSSRALRSLFYPPIRLDLNGEIVGYGEITREQAVEAIDRFLAGNRVVWDFS